MTKRVTSQEIFIDSLVSSFTDKYNRIDTTGRGINPVIGDPRRYWWLGVTLLVERYDPETLVRPERGHDDYGGVPSGGRVYTSSLLLKCEI